ncbi:transcriptional regulator [Streptomyces orinoci]|uniref:Tetratricopeptide repeat protein n=1 Tax=Streptomyces orinoci TaxID=67339 RepID=A0ABV3JR02_STRON|nr:transcriptional regulator [Streptomyces orinoci]
MASSPVSPAPVPNTAFRALRGQRSPGEFAAAVRRAAREIGEQVSCDARYIGRVESGEIRCPNYAYERVFRHMFPGREPADMGFLPREAVRGRGARNKRNAPPPRTESPVDGHAPFPGYQEGDRARPGGEESEVLRRAFMTGGTAAMAAASLGGLPGLPGIPAPRRAGESEARAVEEAVRQIRLLDDRHGADALYRRAARPLRAAYELLDAGIRRQEVADRLHIGAGELAISVGWLAHDSGRPADARSHYAEALATARVAGDAGLEAHAFCNTAFLARDAGRPREALRAAQAAQQAARGLGSARLLSLAALREAGGWAGLGDRTACEGALSRARTLFGRGPDEADPEWMSFFGEAELEGLQAQCWSALGDWPRAAAHAERAVALQDPHFARNIALYTAQLAGDLVRAGEVEAAAEAGGRGLDLLAGVRSARIRAMLADTTRRLRSYRRNCRVADFLERAPL